MITLSGIQLGLFIGGGMVLGAILGVVGFMHSANKVLNSKN